MDAALAPCAGVCCVCVVCVKSTMPTMNEVAVFPTLYHGSRTDIDMDFIIGINEERDAGNLQYFYENVPLSRQHAARQVLQLAGRVIARSPFYQEGLLRILQALAESHYDGDDIYGLCLDGDEVIRGEMLAIQASTVQDAAASTVGAIDTDDNIDLVPRALMYSPTAGL